MPAALGAPLIRPVAVFTDTLYAAAELDPGEITALEEILRKLLGGQIGRAHV